MNHKLINTWGLLAVLLFNCNQKNICQTVSPEQLVDQIFMECNRPGSPGAAIAIVKDGKIIFKKGYGSANLEHNIPVNTSTVFEIASLSKQFTAFAVLLLEDQGKLSLDDDIRKYLPEFPDYGDVITLKHLLYHTSGVREETDLLCMAGWRFDDVITHEQIFGLLCRQKGLSFPPGTEYRYTNSGYSLLAEIVERVSGQPFADFAQDYIFKPLGMNSTMVHDNHERIISNMADSYHPEPAGYYRNTLSSTNIGPSCVLSTVDDLSIWAKNFENATIGNKNLIQKMAEGGTLKNGQQLTYAMGQDVDQYKGQSLIYHNGAVAGYRSLLVRFPNQHLSIVILSNNASVETQGAAIRIADAFIMDQAVAEKPVEPAPEPAGGKEYSGDPALLAKYAGKYELRPEYIIKVTAENAGLLVEAHEVPSTRLFQISENEFSLPAMNAKLTFVSDDAGEFNQIMILLNGQQMIAKRVKTFNAANLNPDEYKGDFFSSELGTVYTINSTNGKLFARNVRLSDIELTAIESDQFSTANRFLRRLEFTRDQNNMVTGFVASGGRISDIKFVKIGD